MNIYNPDGSVLIANVPITSSAKHYEEMMKSNYIKLSWNDNVFRTLPTGAYIEVDHVRYKLFEDYKPEAKDEVKCTYEPEFQHPMMILDHTPCLFTTRNVSGEEVKEPTWTYTGTLQLIVGRINTIISEELGVVLDTQIVISDKTLSPSATVSFDGDTIWSALGKVCQAWDNKIEFHVLWDITRGTAESVNGCLYFGDIAIDEEYKGGVATLTDGVNVTTTSRTKNNKNDYANYFVVRGGTRNITNVTASGDNVQTDTRMTLNATKYPGSIIDKRDNENQPKIQDILIFDDIYPSLTLYCVNIRERVRRRQDEDGNYIVKEYNADGSIKSYKEYSVYYMRLYYPVKDSEGNVTSWKEFSFDPTKDMVSGKTLKCSFAANEEGKHSSLAGRDFELRYHTANRTIPASSATGDSGISIKTGDWEIVFEESDDMIIPNSDTLAPYGESTPSLQCDTLLLYNILLTGDYLTNAQNKLEASALEEITNRMTDYDNYTLKSYPHIFKKSNPNLFVGQKVTYTTRGNVMESHVIKLETSLECTYQQTITLGNAKIKGTITSVKDDVKAMSGVIDVNTTSINTITATLSKIMRQIREWADNFLSRKEDDTAEGHITFEKGLTAEQTAKLNAGATIGDLFSFDASGNIVASTLTSEVFKFDKDGNTVARSLTSDNYNTLAITDDHKDKRGFTIAVKDSIDGTYKLLIDELRAWSKTITDELVAKGTVSNGDFVSGFLGGKGWGITSREVINSAGTPEEKWTAEFDNIVVRGGLKVYEMVVSQLVGENDNRVFTGMLEVDHYDVESGKVYLNTNDGQTYNPFRTGDYIMVQRFTYDTSETADVTKGYELIVEDYGHEGEGEDMLAWVTFNNFTSSFVENPTPEALIAEGDTFVRVDNIQDPDRKGIVQIVSVGTATPYMDVIHGLKTDPDNALKARMGNLQGIVHPVFGHLLGFGLYSSNAYLTGDFVIARTGESIDTKFQVLEDRFSSQIAKTEDGLTDENNFLHNGRFCTNDQAEIDGWTESGDDAVWYFAPDGNAFMVNGQTTMDGTNRVTLDVVGGKKVLHMSTDSDESTPPVTMTQANALIKQPTTHEEYGVDANGNDTTTRVNDTMYLSCKLLPKAGTKVSVLLGETLGFTLAISKTYDKDATIWQSVETSGVWDGKGDLVITVDGDCYITDVMLTTDPVDNLAASYNTSITQTAKKIELQAVKVTNQGKDISTLQQTAESLTSTVSSHTGSISTLQQTAESLTSTVSSHTGSISTLQQTANSISASVGGLKDGLSATGINIDQHTVTIKADNFKVQNRSNQNQFYSDGNGNLVVSGTVYATSGTFNGTVTATSGSIGGWTIGSDALWSGTKNNTANAFTTSGITIGSTGIRSTKWRLESDGSGALASNNISWDASGNVTMKNVTMNNVTANSGTFKGIINAYAGFIMKTEKFTANQEYFYLDEATTIAIIQTSYGVATGDAHFQKIVLPQNPNVGQILTLLNMNINAWYTELRIYGNGHKIIPSCGDTLWGNKTWDAGDYLPLAPKRGEQLVFDGEMWWQINMFDGY